MKTLSATLMLLLAALAVAQEPTSYDPAHERLCAGPWMNASLYPNVSVHDDAADLVLTIDGRALPACRSVLYSEPTEGATRTRRDCGNAPGAECVTYEVPLPLAHDLFAEHLHMLGSGVRRVGGEADLMTLEPTDAPWARYADFALRVVVDDVRAVIVPSVHADRLTETVGFLVTVHPF